MTSEEDKRVQDSLYESFEQRRYGCPRPIPFVLRPDDAIEFIQRGRELGLTLVGVEGAEIQPNGQLQFSTLKYETSLGLGECPADMPQQQFVDHTIAVIRSAPADKWVFEVAFDD